MSKMIARFTRIIAVLFALSLWAGTPAIAGLTSSPLGLATFTSPTLGAKFVLIPAGTFMMGSPASEMQRNDDEKQYQVTISRPFYMQITEVTRAQWKKVMGGDMPSDDRPVMMVTWDDIQTFISELNSIEGTDKYRLPTEAEWEYAARAGTQADWYGYMDDIAWYIGNSGKNTHVVGQKRPNPWFLSDMLGNVWEWVQDWYGVYPSGSVTDPVGPSDGSYRVFRGGSFTNDAGSCRAAERGFIAMNSVAKDNAARTPEHSLPGFYVGFRLVRTP
jgi:formylglycine-generating enzyme required for sulfatase activity